MPEHSPEPWSWNAKEMVLYDAQGEVVLDNGECYQVRDEDFVRIVACVNFCKGLSTEFLETHIAADLHCRAG